MLSSGANRPGRASLGRNSVAPHRVDLGHHGDVECGIGLCDGNCGAKSRAAAADQHDIMRRGHVAGLLSPGARPAAALATGMGRSWRNNPLVYVAQQGHTQEDFFHARGVLGGHASMRLKADSSMLGNIFDLFTV